MSDQTAPKEPDHYIVRREDIDKLFVLIQNGTFNVPFGQIASLLAATQQHARPYVPASAEEPAPKPPVAPEVPPLKAME